MKPKLYFILPCYNEEQVLPVSSRLFLDQLERMVQQGLIHPDSRILFVDDGSRDRTWEIITELSRCDRHFVGIRQSCNRGQQNALLAGLMEAKENCDIAITLDCDGQDDVAAAQSMVEAYLDGCEIVYGVRSDRNTDTPGKRMCAQMYYRVLRYMGAEVVYNHSDYRLVSRKVLCALDEYGEGDLYLRGLFPLVGFKSTCIPYERKERLAGKTHYPFRRMFSLAMDGITALSIRPIRMVGLLGLAMAAVGGLGMILHSGTDLIYWLICLVGGVQLTGLGIVGEYVGRIHREVKGRPRYHISDRTEDDT